jgi:glycosyltransferase involved in cell wall biosynthesis
MPPEKIRMLYLGTYMHGKNEYALTHYPNIEITRIHHPNDLTKYNLKHYDCVYSPAIPIPVAQYPNTRFLFGPQFSVFPDNRLLQIMGPNTSYILLSTWVKQFWSQYIQNHLHLVDNIPFAVDTATFSPKRPIQERTKVILYYKRRHPDELRYVENYLKSQQIEYKIFNYTQRYEERDYIEYLQQAKYAIWVTAHESQGFALQEALAMDVPLLVWSVTSMKQEYGSNHPDIPTTTIPFWDSTCGEVFYDASAFSETYQRFLSKLETYRPREFVLKTLSTEVCETRFIDLIKKNLK